MRPLFVALVLVLALSGLLVTARPAAADRCVFIDRFVINIDGQKVQDGGDYTADGFKEISTKGGSVKVEANNLFRAGVPVKGEVEGSYSPDGPGEFKLVDKTNDFKDTVFDPQVEMSVCPGSSDDPQVAESVVPRLAEPGGSREQRLVGADDMSTERAARLEREAAERAAKLQREMAQKAAKLERETAARAARLEGQGVLGSPEDGEATTARVVKPEKERTPVDRAAIEAARAERQARIQAGRAQQEAAQAALAAERVVADAALLRAAVGDPPVWQPVRDGDNWVLVGAGDIAQCGSTRDSATSELLKSIGGTVFTTGDTVYSRGTVNEYINCFHPAWGEHRARTRPTIGNHEFQTAGGSPYYAYFGENAGPAGKGYYSYNYGGWHVIALNGNLAAHAGSEQEQWLRADLAANPAACTLAYWHQPRFSSGRHGSSTKYQDLWQALYEFGADVVLNGHDHNYERFAPQDPAGRLDSERGIREFVVGTGGAGLRSIRRPIANSEIRNTTAHGVLKMTLHDGRYDWEFIPVPGQEFRDSGSASCVP